MYTKVNRPGKFEHNKSQMVAGILLDICNDGSHGDEIDFGELYTDWYGLIKGKRNYFIVHEDNNGFFSYDALPLEEGLSLWEGLLSEYNGYN